MKAIIIGLGSMGRRRARLLREIMPTTMLAGIDSNPERRQQFENEFNSKAFDRIETACEFTEAGLAFVSTSPLSHGEIISECLKRNLHVFSELNLTDNLYDENIKLANDRGKVLFLSSTFLYREEIKRIKDEVEGSNGPLSYMYHAGQYLPDWHPWENYKDVFFGKKETNGCREFMAIEFPWLYTVFGKVKNYYCIKDKISNLEIDFPDIYRIMFEHESGCRGMIVIDVVSRKPVRNFELFGRDLYLTWNGTPEGLIKFDYHDKMDIPIATYDKVDHKEGYSSFIVENAYRDEIANFLDTVNGRDKPRYSFETDKNILELIDLIENQA